MLLPLSENKTTSKYVIILEAPLGRARCTWRTAEWILEEQDGIVWTGLIWLRIEVSGGLW
jgi:hypothetical protein